ncbi:MAG TPA: 3-keto-5-aminohexanoate cleavage protein [Planctomycetaceae bacterium]|nr:3-keto-5-aminohexanoate cleavage protein [Blastopirellula sp.]HAY82361.1 3-keto-5-aminohexanoate cleavage protein [Planctomycetaceae bacterium]
MYPLDDLIVNFAPTGMVPTREMTPHVPLHCNEIIDEVLHAVELGITVAHLHARDKTTGEPTQDPEVYATIIDGIRRDAPDLVLCVSLSGRRQAAFALRSAPLELDGILKPDMASLTLSSLNFPSQASVNEPEMIQTLAIKMNARGIKPELEAFDLGMLNYAHYLIKKTILHPPYYINLLFGNIAGAQANLAQAGMMLMHLPEHCYAAFAGLGTCQLAMNSIAIANGQAVRVGLEDNIWFDSAKSRLATNTDLLQRVLTIAAYHDRKIMKPSSFRRRLNLKPGAQGGYGCKVESATTEAPEQQLPDTKLPPEPTRSHPTISNRPH